MYWRDSYEKETIRVDNRRRVPAADNSSVHPIDAGEITDATVTRIDNRINLNEKQVKDLNALLADMTAKRCFAPANITEDESALMVDITTNDGAKHIIFNDEVYLYSSADDAIWYNIDNADQLRSDIEALVK